MQNTSTGIYRGKIFFRIYYAPCTQEVVVANDSPCGSTIGPMLSAKLGVRTVDIGGPTLSMHSIREMCCTSSVYQSIKLFEVG